MTLLAQILQFHSILDQNELSRKRIQTRQQDYNDDVLPFEEYRESRKSYTVLFDQINLCYSVAAFDAVAVLMRKSVEMLLIAVFKHNAIEKAIQDSNGDYFQLGKIVNIATTGQNAFHLTRTTKDALSKLVDLGNISAHNIYYLNRRTDIDSIQLKYRVAVEELLSVSGVIH